ncbi:MAG: hypothetical protein CME64_16280 [Halobacteriovoraceae bacterium]|nr:hypothetical protein [Halobacteriovoraceae bacterium]|tara:strand:+ start:70100 stop:70978 length:879 start_codon:yes stop_codon:yes gene_type:complete
MKWLNYHHLLYFREIAKEGSIAKASEKLLVGQPALSHQLKQLEESLGVLLFERKNRKLSLTDAGKKALVYAEEIFNKGEEFLDSFQSKTYSHKRLRIGALAGIPKAMVSKLVEFALEQDPDINILTFEAEWEDLSKKLQSHELDIVLSNKASPRGKNLKNYLVGESQIGVYGHKKFESLSIDFPQSLEGAPFVMQTEQSKLRSDIESELETLKVSYNLRAQCQDYGVKKLLAAQGVGLVFLPELAMRVFEIETNLVKIGTLENIKEKYWLISGDKVVQDQLTDKILEMFKYD